MLYRTMFKSLFLFVMFGHSLLFSVVHGEKKFDVETGLVLFNISGFATLTNDVNMSIKGEGLLRFKDWGIAALIEENYEEVTSGAVNDIHKVQLCEKLENKERFDVDFDTKKILERPMPKGNFRDNILKGLKKTGQDTIAGYNCDVWEAEGIKKCIYKGIPLLVEHYVLGAYYQKKATTVNLEMKPTPSNCVLPDFPVENFSLFKTNIKTKTLKLPTEFSELILHVLKEMQQKALVEDDLSVHQKRALLDKLGENIFQKQKKLLPELLDSMKKARVCLQQANNWVKANTCIEQVVVLKVESTKDKQNTIEQWSGQEKKDVLDEFDENIFLLESKMKCIRASENIYDLSNCMK